MSEDDLKEGMKDVFGDLSDSEPEEEKKETTKKRVRAVESSEEEEENEQEKRAHIEELQREVDNVFSDEDFCVWSNKVRPFAFRKGKTSAGTNNKDRDNDNNEDNNQNDVACILPPHLVLQGTSIRIEYESLLVQIAGFIR